MVLYYQDRIQQDYVFNLRAAFKRKDNLRSNKSTIGIHFVSVNELSVLRKLVFDGKVTEHAKLVSCA